MKHLKVKQRNFSCAEKQLCQKEFYLRTTQLITEFKRKKPYKANYISVEQTKEFYEKSHLQNNLRWKNNLIHVFGMIISTFWSNKFRQRCACVCKVIKVCDWGKVNGSNRFKLKNFCNHNKSKRSQYDWKVSMVKIKYANEFPKWDRCRSASFRSKILNRNTVGRSLDWHISVLHILYAIHPSTCHSISTCWTLLLLLYRYCYLLLL